MNVQTPARPNALEFDYKAAARSILPRLARTAANSVKMRRLDDDAAAALKESGLTRMLTPKNFGGFELSPSSNIWTCAELGNVCSSASWVLMVCLAHDYIVGRFPAECQHRRQAGQRTGLLCYSL